MSLVNWGLFKHLINVLEHLSWIFQNWERNFAFSGRNLLFLKEFLFFTFTFFRFFSFLTIAHYLIVVIHIMNRSWFCLICDSRSSIEKWSRWFLLNHWLTLRRLDSGHWRWFLVIKCNCWVSNIRHWLQNRFLCWRNNWIIQKSFHLGTKLSINLNIYLWKVDFNKRRILKDDSNSNVRVLLFFNKITDILLFLKTIFLKCLSSLSQFIKQDLIDCLKAIFD